MKKINISFKIIVILIIAVVTIPLIYTNAVGEKVTDFFEVNTTKIAKEETLEMNINLDQIEYESFTFELASDSEIDNVEINQEGQLEVEKEENEIKMQIDKNSINLSKIVLYYNLPQDVKVGDTINFAATVTNNDNLEETKEKVISISIIEKEDNTENNVNDKDNADINKDINIDKDKNQAENENVKNNNDKKVDNNSGNENLSNSKISTEKNVSNTTTLKNSSTSSEMSKNTVTYNGSSNNYLENLYVSNYNFEKSFSKEDSTYFLKVGSDVEDLNVVAVAEDSNSTVVVYGNEDLKDGLNKILVTVNSEDGSVRNYRIFVSKE